MIIDKTDRAHECHLDQTKPAEPDPAIYALLASPDRNLDVKEEAVQVCQTASFSTAFCSKSEVEVIKPEAGPRPLPAIQLICRSRLPAGPFCSSDIASVPI